MSVNPSPRKTAICLTFGARYTHMKWSRDLVFTWGYMRDLMLTVDLDRLNVISSGTYYEDRCKSIFSKRAICSPNGLKFDINVDWVRMF
jgi:hypothetical protein